MISLFARLTFFAALIAGLAMWLLGAHSLQIDTNLNDLNPEKVTDAKRQSALTTLGEDITQRFMVVIQGESRDEVTRARTAMQQQLGALPALNVIAEDDVQARYLDALSSYRFNLLSADQRRSLEATAPAQIASQAQRKLYQLGEGVRILPFAQDPLGWYSDYVLTRLNTLDNIGSPAGQADQAVSSFGVTFTAYPKSMPEQHRLYLAINDVKTQIENTYAVRVLHSGMFFFAVDSAQAAKQDIQLIAVGSTLGVLVLMLLVFRSLLPLLLSLSSIALGVGFGVLASVYTFGSVHVLTIVFGASLIGIVVDYSLHYFYHFLSHQQQPQAKTNNHHTLLRAMLLSVVTSLIGYAALALSDLLILKKVALFSCSGLAMAWLSVMVLGPLVTRRAIEARQSMLKRVIGTCQQVFARRPRVLIGMTLILAATSAVYLTAGKATVNDDPRQFFHVSASLLQQEQDVAALTQVYEPGRYMLVQGQSEHAVYAVLTQLYDQLGEQRQALTSVLDWLPSPQQQRDNYALQARLYNDGGALDAFAARLGLPTAQIAGVKDAYRQAADKTLTFPDLMAALPSLPPLWIEQDGTIFSFVLIRKNSDLASIEAAAAQVPGAHYINTLANASEALKAQRQTGAVLLLLAYGLIAVMMALYYRQLRVVLLLLIPFTASLITLAGVSLLGQAITVFHVMALFLVLGLGMDYIIFAREMANQRATTQQAILLSAVTSLLSFGLLAFSSMPIVQAFGSTILIGNTINFIAAISLFNGPHHLQEKRPDVR